MELQSARSVLSALTWLTGISAAILTPWCLFETFAALSYSDFDHAIAELKAATEALRRGGGSSYVIRPVVPISLIIATANAIVFWLWSWATLTVANSVGSSMTESEIDEMVEASAKRLRAAKVAQHSEGTPVSEVVGSSPDRRADYDMERV